MAIAGRAGSGDSFVQEERITTVVPDSGPVSITARVFGIKPGEWSVVADLATFPAGSDTLESRARSSRAEVRRLQPAQWSWRRWKVYPGAPHPLKTRWARIIGFDSMPAVIPGSWIALVALGVAIGFLFQALLLPRDQFAVATVLPISLLAVVSGVIGGKLWYIALNLRSWRKAPQDGWCIQGALVGASAVGTGAVALLHLPAGLLLDTTAPGLFIGVGVGRLGCFFTGCCAGRPTASRFGVWCSDRRVGARRIPTQLLESLSAICIGAMSLVVFLGYRFAVPGALFVGSMAAYTLCRQLILPLRLEQRRSALGSPLTAVGAALLLCASVVWLVLSAR